MKRVTKEVYITACELLCLIKSDQDAGRRNKLKYHYGFCVLVTFTDHEKDTPRRQILYLKKHLMKLTSYAIDYANSIKHYTKDKLYWFEPGDFEIREQFLNMLINKYLSYKTNKKPTNTK